MSVCLLGMPYDAQSSFLRGPADAPAAIRKALHSGSANYRTELGSDVSPGRWEDLGDLDIPDEVDQALTVIEDASREAADGHRLLSLGGDHMVTWPLVRGVRHHHPSALTIVHFDAHPDLYDSLDGNRNSHACPFARIMEERLADRLVQIGIRTMTGHERDQADRFAVEVHEYRTWNRSLPDDLAGPVYLTIDVDALDPAFAPGVSHHEPGGMTTRELLSCLHQLAARPVDVVAADVVEINPRRDLNDMTAMVGAKLVRELLGLMISAGDTDPVHGD